jgi:hypothetical protein
MTMATKTLQHGGMYTATACDLCGGPTLLMPSGSIWCGAEDPHKGGHFVVRVAFERAPNKPAAKVPGFVKAAAPYSVKAKPKSDTDGFDLGMDDFIGGKP